MLQSGQTGIFCISLDFELHWGTFETVPLNAAGKQRFLNTRKIIPRMLELFDQYGISVTWATVGMLFNADAKAWMASKPSKIPNYTHKHVSSYEWAKNNNIADGFSQYYFAPDLISAIAAHPNMELATHTYSHYYCQEEGQTAEDFLIDLQLASQKASILGIGFKSLVFPRNQYNEHYLQVCKEAGLESVRTNPEIWFWDHPEKSGILKKIVRALDSYFPFQLNTSIPLHKIDTSREPMLLPASRFFRPWARNAILNRMKMKRMLDEMTYAAENGEFYHLWWHPHNFGTHPEQCLKELEILLKHYSFLNSKYGFLSLHMKGARDFLKKSNT